MISIFKKKEPLHPTQKVMGLTDEQEAKRKQNFIGNLNAARSLSNLAPLSEKAGNQYYQDWIEASEIKFGGGSFGTGGSGCIGCGGF